MSPQQHGLLALQRSVGNRAISSLVQRDLPSLAQFGAGLQAWWQHDDAPEIAFIASVQIQDKAWRAARSYIVDTAPSAWRTRWPRSIGVSRGPYNALRHCIWSCLTMLRYLASGPRVPSTSAARGVTVYDLALTRVLGTLAAHEADVTPESDAREQIDSALDRENNDVGALAGVEIARANDVANRTMFGMRGIYDELAITHCIMLFEAGRTKMMGPGGSMVGTNGWRNVPDPTIWD